MKLFEQADFEQAVLRAAEHFQYRGLRPVITEKDYYVTEALDYPESRKPIADLPPNVNIHANAVAKSPNAAPGAIVCKDFQTVSTLFHLYSAHWENTTQDRLTNEASRQVRGEPAPLPDPSLYNCQLLAPGTPVRVENPDAFSTGIPMVTALLPDGTVIRGVTLPTMLSKIP